MADSELFAALDSKPLSELSESESREARDLAWRILRADYWRDVRSISESIRDAIKDGEVTDSESLSDRIHEECDGHQRVIYTSLNMETLLVSDNADAYADEFGEDGLIKDGSVNWAAMAYCALQADLNKQLEAEGVDLNDPCPEPDEDEDEEDPDH
jgi:hypothetical protein